MEEIICVLADSDSSFFPVWAIVKSRGYKMFFQSADEAKRAVTWRFGSVRFVDKRREAGNE